MPRIERSSRVAWQGNVARGGGTISAATSGAFNELPYSLPTRIGQAEGKTSPEELLAAAHGACITMSLATELTEAGTPPGRLETTCKIVMDEVEGQGHRVEAASLDDDALQTAAEKADKGCPFSQLLERAGANVHVAAHLA
jgi:osmotically inducible protein OsmC